jgi:hypothetical protein
MISILSPSSLLPTNFIPLLSNWGTTVGFTYKMNKINLSNIIVTTIPFNGDWRYMIVKSWRLVIYDCEIMEICDISL